ncbi:hypothetical protein ACL7TT_07245 [Microbulbifer sp. 2304DJ12-6]|uniref:hypothetical protein n=1 Tax=Microbulbifer sp. 2304DJ12-6 TaxID=3233340 RepID=UPI0039AF0546
MLSLPDTQSPKPATEPVFLTPGESYFPRSRNLELLRGHAYELLIHVLKEGFTGIGVKQKGSHKDRFLHKDDLEPIPDERTRPTIWAY